MPIPIVIVGYDSQWPQMFAKERRKILGVLGERAVAVQHIGSTAVPGLAAKPIIDILVGVRRISDLDECIGPLASIGYAYDPFPRFPDRRFFRDGSMGAAPHHVHVNVYGSDFWDEKLLFRDWLRAHPEAALDYLALKQDLAARFGEDRERYERYTDGKNAYIAEILTLARSRSEHARAGRWKPGDHVLLRDVLNDRILSAQPYVVVRDTPELTALWMAPGTPRMMPHGRDDVVRKRLAGDWTLFRDTWNGEGFLRLTVPGHRYSVLVLWAPGRSVVARWYVNIEEPFRRTSLGFDYLDQLLDVVFTPDRTTWRWKDEDEFQQAIDLGLIARERAAVLRSAGEEAIEAVSSRRPPYTDDWISWRPDPEWELPPSLPAGWDQLPIANM